MSKPSAKLTEQEIEFKLSQIVATQAADGIIVTEEEKTNLREYISGRISFEELRAQGDAELKVAAE
jgi:hypothetical protein